MINPMEDPNDDRPMYIKPQPPSPLAPTLTITPNSGLAQALNLALAPTLALAES